MRKVIKMCETSQGIRTVVAICRSSFNFDVTNFRCYKIPMSVLRTTEVLSDVVSEQLISILHDPNRVWTFTISLSDSLEDSSTTFIRHTKQVWVCWSPKEQFPTSSSPSQTVYISQWVMRDINLRTIWLSFQPIWALRSPSRTLGQLL